MITLNKILLVSSAVLFCIIGILCVILSFKNKRLKEKTEENKGLKKTVDIQEKTMNTMLKARKQTEAKIEKIETGDNTNDFNSTIDLLHNLKR